jgi:hypothetical protein
MTSLWQVLKKEFIVENDEVERYRADRPSLLAPVCVPVCVCVCVQLYSYVCDSMCACVSACVCVRSRPSVLTTRPTTSDSIKSEKRVFQVTNEGTHPFLVKLHSCFQSKVSAYARICVCMRERVFC